VCRFILKKTGGQTDARARCHSTDGQSCSVPHSGRYGHSRFMGRLSPCELPMPFPRRICGRGNGRGHINYYLGSRAYHGLAALRERSSYGSPAGSTSCITDASADLEYDFADSPGANPNALRCALKAEAPDAGWQSAIFFLRELPGTAPSASRVCGKGQWGQRKEIECRYAVLGQSEVKLVLEDTTLQRTW